METALFDDIIWRSYEDWIDGETNQTDGRLIHPDGRTLQLDIWTVNEVSKDFGEYFGPSEYVTRWVKNIWNNGSVKVGHEDEFGATSLIVPHDKITEEIAKEAITRFISIL